VRIFDADAVRRGLDLDTAYRSQVEAFRCLRVGLADLAPRLILSGTDGGDGLRHQITLLRRQLGPQKPRFEPTVGRGRSLSAGRRWPSGAGRQPRRLMVNM
jgi:hypothetical protein